MSSAPVLDRTHTEENDAQWVEIVSPAKKRTPNGAGVVVAIANLRSTIESGELQSIEFDPEDLREIDEDDRRAAEQYAANWDDEN
ncbi:MAG: hypothetical protein ACOH14_07705 [Rhodoglobus sp.]